MCGIIGISSYPDVATLCIPMLQSLQHRGQDGCGIMTSDGKDYFLHKKEGLIFDVFGEKEVKKLPGYQCIGHNRYSTTGISSKINLQPLLTRSLNGWLGLVHNGNLTNTEELTKRLENEGSIFQTTTDTEIIMHLMAKCKTKHMPDALICALEQVEGSYSLIAMDKQYLVATRDPMGFRPLIYGKLNNSYIFASETCALDVIGATDIKEVLPGQMIVVDSKTNKLEVIQAFKPKKLNRCIFELIYFAKPNSEIFDHETYVVRKNLGKILAKEFPVEADVVIPVPDSGIAAAMGYSQESGIPFEMGIIRSHYQRTFIQPTQALRDLGVKMKLAGVSSCLRGKRVVIVDDSLVRGTTSKKITKMLRDCGAKEVHFRISSPPTVSPCFYGVSMPTKQELIASDKTVSEVRKYINADSLAYLSIEGLSKVVGNGFCNACFSGDYPTNIPLGLEKLAIRKI